MTPTPPSGTLTYRDGIQAERCPMCDQMIRDAAGDRMVPVLLSDVEEIACILEQYVDCPEVWGDTIKRLEQAAGRTVKQMCEAQREINRAAALAEEELRTR